VVVPAGLTPKPPTAFGLALGRFCGAGRRHGGGLTQQRIDRLRLQVGVCPRFITGSDEGGQHGDHRVDPDKRLHVASVVEAATNRRIAALEVEASLAGYRR